MDELIERLRTLIDARCGNGPSGPNYDPELMEALNEAAAAFEAAREDAARWRHARRILTVEDIETSQDMFDAFGMDGDEVENRKADAAIDAAIAASGERDE